MGVVYKAHDERLRRPVALKVLSPERVGDARSRQRFLREAQAAAAVSHPAIAAVYEIGEEGEAVFIAMEYVEGRTLRSLAQSGPLAVEEALRLATRIAEGLDHAHRAGVIHRDIKPENVIVQADGEAKILDFGLAKLREERPPASAAELSQAETKEALTREGMGMGTFGYMSPEQARGAPVDARSDLFSLGVVLYELLTGVNPFRGPTPLDTIGNLLKEEPPPVAARNPKVQQAVSSLVGRLLAKQPEGRPDSARAVIAALADASRAAETPPPPPRSIAVLPFADMSQQKDLDYFCEGIAEELINALARVPGLRVAARTSAFQFKGRPDDVRRIGSALSVGAVLEGSVRAAGGRLRVAAQLVNCADGYQLWSDRYDRAMDDVFAIQDEIAASIAGALQLALGSPEVVSARRRHAGNVEAYHLYLKGRQARVRADVANSIRLFESAVALEPNHAPAQAGLAEALVLGCLWGVVPPRVSRPRAAAAAERAGALDATLPEAHVVRGMVHHVFDWIWAEAEAELRQAIRLDPGEVQGHCWLAALLMTLGRAAEALEHARLARELEPISPYPIAVQAQCLALSGDYEKALAEARRALEIDSRYPLAVFVLGTAATQLGRHAEALAAFETEAAQRARHPFSLCTLGWSLARAGRTAEAETLLAESTGRARAEPVHPDALAWLLGALRRRDEAFVWLERALGEGSTWLIWPTLPCFDSLRADPRFANLVRRVGVPLAG